MTSQLKSPVHLENFSLSVDAWGRLVLTTPEGKQFVGVEPVRVFPLTQPNHWISLVDAEGRERALIADPENLSQELRQILTNEMAVREFVPIIQKILKVEGEPPTCVWSVITDRGSVRFSLESEDQVRNLGTDRIVVVDQRGQRYLIPNTKQLDSSSMKLLRLFL